MLTSPYWSHEITLRFPRAFLPCVVLTASATLNRYITRMAERRSLEGFCTKIFKIFTSEKCSVLTIPLEIAPDTPLEKDSHETSLIPILTTISTCAGLAQIHMSVIDPVYEPIGAEEQYFSMTLPIEKRVISITTLSRRVADFLIVLRRHDETREWLGRHYSELRHPLSVALDPEALKDSPVIITRCDRTEVDCDVLHVATNDSLVLN